MEKAAVYSHMMAKYLTIYNIQKVNVACSYYAHRNDQFFVEIWIFFVNIFTVNQTANMTFAVSKTVSGLNSSSALFYTRLGVATTRPEVFTRAAPLSGRYVRAMMNKSDDWKFLCIEELEVYGEGTQSIL